MSETAANSTNNDTRFLCREIIVVVPCPAFAENESFVARSGTAVCGGR